MLIKKIKSSNFILNLRNSLNIRSIPIIPPNDGHSYSVSDAFCWRNSSDFKTDFRFTDLIDYFTKKKSNVVEIIINNHFNEFIKKITLTPNNLTGKIDLKKHLGDIKEKSGHFFFFHKIPPVEKGNFIIRNSCYTSYSFKGSTPSIVHGNLPVVAKNQQSFLYKKNIIQHSSFKNYIYTTQHNFSNYDKIEAFIINPHNKNLKININDKSILLKPYNSKIFELCITKIYKIRSKCLLLRPIFFVYKSNHFDTFHG